MTKETFEQLIGAEKPVDELPPNGVTAELIEGCSVFNAAGEEIGEIEDIMIDLASGLITHVVVSCNSWLSKAIPWEELRFDPTGACHLLKQIDEDEWHE